MDYSKDIRTRDVSKIDTAVDAASFLVGIVQTYLGKNKQNKLESPPGAVHIIVINNNPYINNQLYNNSTNANDTIRVPN